MISSIISRAAWFPVAVAGLALVACNNMPEPSLTDPRIQEITVDNIIQAEQPDVAVRVVIPGIANKRVRRVSAEFRSTLSPDRPYVTSGTDFTEASGNRWQGKLPALNVGPYEVRVLVTLESGGANSDGSITPAISENISGVKAFNVGPDTNECFNFASELAGNQNWSHAGVRSSPTTPVIDACPAQAFWFNQRLVTTFASYCMPEDGYLIDLLSPVVIDRPGWAATQGVVTSAFWNVTTMQMQPILGLTGTQATAIVAVTDDGTPIFHPATGSPAAPFSYRTKIDLQSGSVNSLRLRFFVPPLTGVAEGLIQIRYACPIPDRPG